MRAMGVEWLLGEDEIDGGSVGGFLGFDFGDFEGFAGAGDVAGGDWESEFFSGFDGGVGVGFFGDVVAVFSLIEPDVEQAGLLEGEVVAGGARATWGCGRSFGSSGWEIDFGGCG